KSPLSDLRHGVYSQFLSNFHFLHCAIFYRAMMAFCVISNSHPIKKSLPQQTRYYLYKYLKSKRMWSNVPPDTSNSLSPGAKLINLRLVSLNIFVKLPKLNTMPRILKWLPKLARFKMISSPVVLFLIVKLLSDRTVLTKIYNIILSGSTATLPALYTVNLLLLSLPSNVGSVWTPTSAGLMPL